MPDDSLPVSVDICDERISAGSPIRCYVTASTSNNQTFLRGPASETKSALTHFNRKYSSLSEAALKVESWIKLALKC